MTIAISIFIRESLKQSKIPFEIVSDQFYSPSNIKALEKSLQELKDGKVVSKTLDELKDME